MEKGTGKTSKDVLIIILLTLGLTLLIWIPFLARLHSLYGLDFSAGFNSIYRNYDGLEYVIIAKSLYNPKIIASLPYTLRAGYYASHFPGYSLLILAFSPFMGFLKSMLFVSVASTIASAITFYFLLKEFNLSNHPLWMSFVFLILPARWLIVHSVGSAETTFILFTLVSIYYFLKFEKIHRSKYIFLSGLFGVFAQLTRPPGILLFIAYGLYLLFQIIQKEKKDFFRNLIQTIAAYYPLLLIPLSLLGMFIWYGISYHDFFAYFHSGDNIHLTFLPFSVFNKHLYWVGDIWLEDIVYIFLLGFLGGMYLLKEKLNAMAFYLFTYLSATVMVTHRDISRYALPVFPFVLIAFQKVIVSKEFKIVMIIIALAIYLYAQNFIIENTAPIPNLNLLN